MTQLLEGRNHPAFFIQSWTHLSILNKILSITTPDAFLYLFGFPDYLKIILRAKPTQPNSRE
ncbi:MAG: hypothetical protein AAF600_16860 [Bacteroidota bacterium]